MPSQLTAARSKIAETLRQRYGAEQVKHKGGQIAWIVPEGASVGLRWAYVSYVSGYSEDFIRLRNDMDVNIPKSFWRSPLPEIPTFELTVLFAEITQDFVSDFDKFVSFLAHGRDEIYTWEIFGDASYPNYGWSLKAQQLCNDQK
jgi:hypothetical protein